MAGCSSVCSFLDFQFLTSFLDCQKFGCCASIIISEHIIILTPLCDIIARLTILVIASTFVH